MMYLSKAKPIRPIFLNRCVFGIILLLAELHLSSCTRKNHDAVAQTSTIQTDNGQPNTKLKKIEKVDIQVEALADNNTSDQTDDQVADTAAEPTITTSSTWYSMPNLDSWPGLNVHQPPAQTAAGDKYALAYHFDAKIFKKKASGGEWLTYVRRSDWITAFNTEQGPGCEKGTWYKAVDGGYICTSRGFKVSEEKKAWPGKWLLPDTSRILPFAYAEVTRQEALSLYRLPKSEELEQLKAGKTSIEVVNRQLTGDNLLALHRKVSRLEHTFYETVRGRFVLAKDLKPMPGSQTHGFFFSNKANLLSNAFVFTKKARAYKIKSHDSNDLEDLGNIPRYARFPIAKASVKIGGESYVKSHSGQLVKRGDVRLAKIIQPPALVGEHKWIHVDRKEQTLTAYTGRKPIFATMISSGKPGFDTPSGLQRIYEKHISRTMRGSDPKEGSYVVEEVPWTMFYQDSYALHGAYWHDDFGNTKSHGCTNIPPADARWLFYWTSPTLKTHWHASRDGLGTFVYIQ